MRSMVDIDVVIDGRYTDPKVIIQTSKRSRQVENIIEAIETASENFHPSIPVADDGGTLLLSQRNITRIYTEHRKTMLRTDDRIYSAGMTLTQLDSILDTERFIRISQSEIVNMYKVKRFDLNTAGTIGIEFDNGDKSWVARSRVKVIKEMLRGKVPGKTPEGRGTLKEEQ